ncbi:T7SS effector LXG polymorphic toxin [Listeria costaricensis]|uniref:T7SS effector LXG polymorphic toxin n=1 Tax=Listeria costaricensis TaxID=2026604 RepID=UPI000C06FC4C|nr:T7SS effector LXG polymorphic toxin [Listeria costaricensis]
MSRIDIAEVSDFLYNLTQADEETRVWIKGIQTTAQNYAQDTSLDGQAVKSSKAYFNDTYSLLCRSILEAMDESEQLLAQYVHDFHSQVDPSFSARIDAELLYEVSERVDRLESKKENLQRSLSGSTAGIYEGQAQQIGSQLTEAIKQENILEKYIAFEQSHGDTFTQLHDLVQEIRRTTDQLLNQIKFNDQTGIYNMPSSTRSALAELQKDYRTVKKSAAEFEKELQDYSVYAVKYIDENGEEQVMWVLEQFGIAVENVELQDYLEKHGDPSKYPNLTLDQLEDKINDSWKDETYYLGNGRTYEGIAGKILQGSAYVQGGAEWAQDSGLYDAMTGIGLSIAGVRISKKVSSSKIIIKSNLGNEIDITPLKKHKLVNNNPGPYGEANSSLDILDVKGNVKTRRYYDENGRAIRDVDMTNHGNPKKHPEYPHEHFWSYDSEGNPTRN